jgi:hypothetical protein
MPTVHFLTQYIWPDAAPTGLYAEDLASRLEQEGVDVRFVGGRGGYRSLQRTQPIERVTYLDHYQGRRGNLRETFLEYISVTRAFRDYIHRFVRRDDLVVVTSAPPNTVTLANCIRRRSAGCIYWLQDYYPELVRGIHDYPPVMRAAFRRYWDRQLSQWDQVVKIGANLGGPSHNSIVIRNWPTMSFEKGQHDFVSRTALYLGNLGYGHHLGLFIAACEKLRDQGYAISIRADGPGVRQLPGWLRAEPPCRDVAESRDALLRHEKHLVAAHPEITEAIFPSKVWNSLAAGRELVCTGFAGEMQRELRISKRVPFEQHVQHWLDLLQPAIGLSQATFASDARVFASTCAR